MRELLVIALVLPGAACLQIGSDQAAGSGGVASPSAEAGTGDGGPSGTGCVQDSTGQIVLCEGIDTCPGVGVEPGAFPDCGFRLRTGAPLDLECLCGNELCPVGVPTTCDEARTLLDGQSALLVCQQQAEGRCIPAATPAAAGSTCDQVCRDECAGAAPCLQLCGC